MFGILSNKITFYYDSKELFNKISQLSAYHAKSLSASSESAIDDFAITEDEADLYNTSIMAALPKIYGELLKMSSTISNAFVDNKVLNIGDERETQTTGSEGNTVTTEKGVSINAQTGKDDNAKKNTIGRFAGQYVELSILNNNSYNLNALRLVDSAIEESIEYGVLVVYYSINVNQTLLDISTSKQRMAIASLNKALFQLKKMPVSSLL